MGNPRRSASEPDRDPLASIESNRVRQSRVLARIAGAVNRAPADGIDAEIERSLQSIGVTLGVDVATFTRTEGAERLTPQFQWSAVGWMDPPFGIDARAAEWWESRQRRGEEIIIDDVSSLPDRADYERALLRHRGTRALVAVPVTSLTEPIGYIIIEHMRKRYQWTPDDLSFLSDYAELLASAVVRQRSEQALVAGKARAEEAWRTQSDFIANLSHEIKTPLTAILGYAEVLADSEALTAQQQHYVDRIQLCATHLSSLLDDTMDITRGDSGKLVPAIQETALGDALDTAVAQVERRARAADVLLDITPAPAQVVHVDGRMLRQILVNLLVNAVKFTPRGGTVSLTTRVEQNAFEIDVVDTGIGIAPRDTERVFETFTRVASARNQDPDAAGGVGLGLPLVRRLAEALGGSVALESELGKGSTFTVRLPIDARPHATARPAYLGGLK